MQEEIKSNTNNNEENDHHRTDPYALDDITEDSSVNESILSVALDGIHKLCESNETQLAQLNDRLSKLLENQQNQTSSLEQYLHIVDECQKELAKLANNQLERHLLHPAIEAVDVLIKQIRHLLEQATSLPENEIFCPFVRPIVDSIKHAALIADAKSKSLDIETIEPRGLDDLDPAKHDIREAVKTDEPSKHRKVERTLIPGLIYRGKVLRQARVSVYRHIQTSNSKGEKNENAHKQQ